MSVNSDGNDNDKCRIVRQERAESLLKTIEGQIKNYIECFKNIIYNTNAKGAEEAGGAFTRMDILEMARKLAHDRKYSSDMTLTLIQSQLNIRGYPIMDRVMHKFSYLW